jgi:hypothetical protein
VKVDELISGQGVECPGVLDVGQDDVLAQAGFDQLDDILNARRQAGRRLGRAMDGRRLQNQADYQTNDCDVTAHSIQTPRSRRAGSIHNERSDRIHLNNMAHMQSSTAKECPRFPGM